MTLLILACLVAFIVVASLCALLASVRHPAVALPPAPVRPSERAIARRTRVVERFDRWGRPMRITDHREIDIPARLELEG